MKIYRIEFQHDGEWCFLAQERNAGRVMALVAFMRLGVKNLALRVR